MRAMLLVIVVASLLHTDALGQSLQLPTIHYFGGSMTVLVPTHGSVQFGSVNRATTGTSQFGTVGLGNRSIGSADHAGGMSVSVRVHDFDAIDRALLEQAASGRQAPGSVTPTFALQGSVPTESQLSSVEHLRRVKSAATVPGKDARQLFERGVQAEAGGKLGAARVYFQMSARRASGQLRTQALAKYDALVHTPALAKSH